VGRLGGASGPGPVSMATGGRGGNCDVLELEKQIFLFTRYIGIASYKKIQIFTFK